MGEETYYYKLKNDNKVFLFVKETYFPYEDIPKRCRMYFKVFKPNFNAWYMIYPSYNLQEVIDKIKPKHEITAKEMSKEMKIERDKYLMLYELNK